MKYIKPEINIELFPEISVITASVPVEPTDPTNVGDEITIS